MKTPSMLIRPRLLALLFAACLGCGASSATMIDIGAGHEAAVSVRNSDFSVSTFVSEQAGTVTLNLIDLNWKDLLQSLSTSITVSNGMQFSMNGPGILQFDIGANQFFTTSIYALTRPSRVLGLYGVDYNFKPAAPVPLPAAGWLLLGGLSLLAARVRRRQSLVPAFG